MKVHKSLPDITSKQVTNLKLLAIYLYNLPEDYKHFHMNTYFTHPEGPISKEQASNQSDLRTYEEHLNHCGSSACAVGHGPSLQEIDKDFKPLSDEYWNDYSLRLFGFRPWSLEWAWCFGGNWDEYDNTPKGAAKRIVYLIKKSLRDFPTHTSVHNIFSEVNLKKYQNESISLKDF